MEGRAGSVFGNFAAALQWLVEGRVRVDGLYAAVPPVTTRKDKMPESQSAKSTLSVLELNHVALHVRDLEASARFYGEVLGLPPLARPAFSFAGAWFALGSQELHLIEATQSESADNQDKERHPFHVAFLVEDAAASAEALRSRGMTDTRGPALRPDGAIQVFVHDPDGHLIEIVSQPLAEKHAMNGTANQRRR